MVTVILSVTSDSTDVTKYREFLNDGDDLVVLRKGDVEPGCNIVQRYNEIVENSDKASDILLLSDCIELHGDVYAEMRDCLYAGEKHALVYGQEIEDRESLIETAKRYLPEYTVTVDANPCCVLIKRTVINMLGFFDAAYESLKYALMDYYCRLNKYGFSAVVAHKAMFSFNNEGQKDECCREAAITHEEKVCADKELFESKYENWEKNEARYATYRASPFVNFLKQFDTDYYPKKRILFDCIIMPPIYCGTSEFQISAFESFYRQYKDKYDIFLYTSRYADEFHELSSKFDNILYPDTIDGTFHLGFAPNQLMYYDPQAVMNKHCLKVVQTMFDIIMVRIDEHFGVDINADVELGIRLSDGIVFISKYTENDFLTCFSNEGIAGEAKYKVIYPTTKFSDLAKREYDLPFEEYFLIAGNHFKHKGVRETIAAVSGTQHSFIAIGYEDNNYIYPNVYSYASGLLDDDFLNFLYANCKAVIFPSLYEGFGLPIATGLKNGKRVIVNSNPLNYELLEHFKKFENYFLFFDSFEQISDIINSADFSQDISHIEYDDSWDRVATELESFFDEILTEDIDMDKLNARWNTYKLIDAKMRDAELRAVEPLNERLTSYYNQFGNYGLFRLLFFAVKEHVKMRHPGLFRFLKGNKLPK
jgi:hypothetical protein